VTLSLVRFRFLSAWLLLVTACAQPPAFPVPTGPPRHVALDVRLPVYVLGTWTVDEFSEALRHELAKYKIDVVAAASNPGLVARVDMGRWTYREWQEIDAALVREKDVIPLGRIRLSDLSMTTLDVAAESVAVLIARGVWTVP
jgi:hypothetical protein